MLSPNKMEFTPRGHNIAIFSRKSDPFWKCCFAFCIGIDFQKFHQRTSLQKQIPRAPTWVYTHCKEHPPTHCKGNAEDHTPHWECFGFPHCCKRLTASLTRKFKKKNDIMHFKFLFCCFLMIAFSCQFLGPASSLAIKFIECRTVLYICPCIIAILF